MSKQLQKFIEITEKAAELVRSLGKWYEKDDGLNERSRKEGVIKDLLPDPEKLPMRDIEKGKNLMFHFPSWNMIRESGIELGDIFPELNEVFWGNEQISLGSYCVNSLKKVHWRETSSDREISPYPSDEGLKVRIEEESEEIDGGDEVSQILVDKDGNYCRID